MPRLQPINNPAAPSRREFLQYLGAGALGLALSARNARADVDVSEPPTYDLSPGPKKLRGLFPIGQTPFTEDDKIDLDSLAAQVPFCNRGGVHGFVWPQIASGWTTLSEAERLSGAEAIVSAGKGGYAAIVIGVQGPDMAAVTRYAQHAAKIGADAIVSLPPAKVTDEKALLDYYQQLGRVTDLPLFAQSTGTMSVDLIVEMFNTIPTMRQVKDEAGVPLERVAELRRRTNDQLRVFSGQGVRTLISEMELGFVGHCPYTGLADVYASAYDLWHAGKRQEGFDMFGRILAFNSLGNADGNGLLVARGVFKPSVHARQMPPVPGGGPGGPRLGPKMSVKAIRKGYEDYLKPYLRA